MSNKLRFLQNTLTLSAVTLIIVVWSTVSFLAYQNKLLENYTEINSLKNSTPKAELNITDFPDWKTYVNEKYGFSIKYHPESPPSEYAGTEDTGQFTYLYSIDFGTVPLKSPHGYTLTVTQPKTLTDYKTELVGHVTDQIDSEKEIRVNGNKWNKLNYQIFIVADYVPATLAFTASQKYNFTITAPASDIDQILSTFKFDTDQSDSSKTYYSSMYKFSLNYPDSFTIEENKISNGLQLLFNKNKADYFSFIARTNYPQGQEDSYLDTASSGTRSIGDNIWKTFYLPQGYPDGGSQDTTPIYALQLEKNNTLYTIAGFQSEEIQKSVYDTLTTVKFIN